MENTNVVEALTKYYESHQQDFAHDLEQLDDWNGRLGDDRLIPMNQLEYYLAGKSPLEIFQTALRGENEEDSRPFNMDDDYFFFDGYGNFVSTNCRDYNETYLDESTVREILDNINHLACLSRGAQEVIDSCCDDDGLLVIMSNPTANK